MNKTRTTLIWHASGTFCRYHEPHYNAFGHTDMLVIFEGIAGALSLLSRSPLIVKVLSEKDAKLKNGRAINLVTYSCL